MSEHSDRVRVVDRRHHAHSTGAAGAVPGERYPTVVERMKERAEEAEAKAREALAWAESEVDAVRARLQRDLERRVREGKSGLIGSVLDVVDNLERAALTASGTAPAVAEGIRLIHQQLLAVLKGEGVEPIETIGRPYDPNLAEAILTEPVEPERDGLVLEQVQRGYLYGDQVLRPARVKVGKAPA